MTQVPAPGVCCLPPKWAKKMENYTQHQKLAGVWHYSVWRKRRQKGEVQSQEHRNTKTHPSFTFTLGVISRPAGGGITRSLFYFKLCPSQTWIFLIKQMHIKEGVTNLRDALVLCVCRPPAGHGACPCAFPKASAWGCEWLCGAFPGVKADWWRGLCQHCASSDHSHQNSSGAVNHSPGEQGRFFSSLLVLQAWIRLI